MHRTTFLDHCCLATFPLRMGNTFYLDILDRTWALCLTWCLALPIDGNIAQSVSCPVYHQPDRKLFLNGLMYFPLPRWNISDSLDVCLDIVYICFISNWIYLSIFWNTCKFNVFNVILWCKLIMDLYGNIVIQWNEIIVLISEYNDLLLNRGPTWARWYWGSGQWEAGTDLPMAFLRFQPWNWFLFHWTAGELLR